MQGLIKVITPTIGGIAVATITVVGSYFVADRTASSHTDQQLTEFKIETTKNVSDVQGDVNALKATAVEMNKHLDRIDKSVGDVAGSVQSLSSYLLNKK